MSILNLNNWFSDNSKTVKLITFLNDDKTVCLGPEDTRRGTAINSSSQEHSQEDSRAFGKKLFKQN